MISHDLKIKLAEHVYSLAVVGHGTKRKLVFPQFPLGTFIYVGKQG